MRVRRGDRRSPNPHACLGPTLGGGLAVVLLELSLDAERVDAQRGEHADDDVKVGPAARAVTKRLLNGPVVRLAGSIAR